MHSFQLRLLDRTIRFVFGIDVSEVHTSVLPSSGRLPDDTPQTTVVSSSTRCCSGWSMSLTWLPVLFLSHWATHGSTSPRHAQRVSLQYPNSLRYVSLRIAPCAVGNASCAQRTNENTSTSSISVRDSLRPSTSSFISYLAPCASEKCAMRNIRTSAQRAHNLA